MIVSDTRYGRSKARQHAQEKANRSGRRIHLQLEPISGGLMVHAQTDRPYFPGAPFITFYPDERSED